MKLELAVDRIEGERVVLVDQDQRVYVWPKQVLPENLHEGQLLFIELSDAPGKPPPKIEPKDILNEILKLD